ncbi:Resolvase [Vibrio chagasii]|uniref:recombinase family protein n=1 Tax=Vibrio aestuarianus TaxID=28171 RepID=UPI00237CE157|nr:recombinase family protein [Vibrio aestuarianus]MDE1318083.1 recombinase family protein [Vibrio aestuarianus]CAH7095729.1 Resolvase [Vibrio chagasii]CAH7139328.1 Resolvase [Vibrio chagasii]CAH7144815.1 Resolvase [Vibrio chagasii]
MTGRTFAYCRVSTSDQETDNQVLTIRNAGYDIRDSRFIVEVISGGTKASERPQFSNLLLHKLEAGDTLVISKIDRLGRDNIDVQTTVKQLCDMNVRVICLDLPIKDLSSAEGKMMLQMFSIFAEFERNRIKERTREGLARVKNQGKKLGRPKAVETTKRVQGCKLAGMSQGTTASHLGIGIATVKRHWNIKS